MSCCHDKYFNKIDHFIYYISAHQKLVKQERVSGNNIVVKYFENNFSVNFVAAHDECSFGRLIIPLLPRAINVNFTLKSINLIEKEGKKNGFYYRYFINT